MTEKEWLTSEDVGELLGYLDSISDVESRFDLVIVAFCRRVWNLLTDPRSKECVELLEEFACTSIPDDIYEAMRNSSSAASRAAGEREMSDPQQSAAYSAAHAVYNAVYGLIDRLSNDVACAVASAKWPANASRAFEATTGGLEPDAEELRWQAGCVRCVFGNPFREVTFNPAWRTDTAVAIAHLMYDSREFGAMPILADALQDAGCEDEHILMHCRDAAATHVRGCWVCDLVLGKA
jgi:hypothetical protein